MPKQKRRIPDRGASVRTGRTMAQKRTTKPSASARSKRNKGTNVIAVSMIVLLVLAALVIVGYISIKDLYSDQIAEGIVIEGIDLSGMAPDEADKVLAGVVTKRMKDISLTIRYGDKQWDYGAEHLHASSNLSDIIEHVTSATHTGSIKQRMDEAKLAKEGHYNNLAIQLSIDDSVVDGFVQSIKSKVDTDPVEPTLSFDPGDYDYEEYSTNAPITQMFAYTEGIPGISLDVQATVDAVKADLRDDFVADVQISADELLPNQDGEVLPPDDIVLLKHVYTKLKRNNGEPMPDRNHNIGLALSNFDGLVIEPNVPYSFNQIVGQRMQSTGYRKAPTITRDKRVKEDWGGGICQGATTLFRAAFYAGCEIIDQSFHSWPSYLTLDGEEAYGMDAMVNWGTADLVFVNRGDTPLYINFYFCYDGDVPTYVDIDIYGLPHADGMSIGFDCSEHEREDPSEPQYIPDTENKYSDETWELDTERNELVYTHVKPHQRHEVNVYRLWLKDGEVKNKEFIHTAIYPMVQGIYYTKPAPVTPPASTDDGGAVG